MGSLCFRAIKMGCGFNETHSSDHFGCISQGGMVEWTSLIIHKLLIAGAAVAESVLFFEA